MNTFVRKGVTYASAMRPPCGLYPNRHEGVILRKTDEKVRVFEIATWKGAESVVWVDENNDPYVRWDGKFYHIGRWFSFRDDWGIDKTRSALIDA